MKRRGRKGGGPSKSRPGDGAAADLFNAIADAVERLGALSASGGLTLHESEDGGTLALAGIEPFSARLTGSSSPYGLVEQYVDGLAWTDLAGGRQCDDCADELNGVAGLAGKHVVEMWPIGPNRYAFQWVRKGDCSPTISVHLATLTSYPGDTPIAGATVTIKRGIAPFDTLGSGTTDAGGDFSAGPVAINDPYTVKIDVDDGHGGTCSRTFSYNGALPCEAGHRYRACWGRVTVETGGVPDMVVTAQVPGCFLLTLSDDTTPGTYEGDYCIIQEETSITCTAPGTLSWTVTDNSLVNGGPPADACNINPNGYLPVCGQVPWTCGDVSISATMCPIYPDWLPCVDYVGSPYSDASIFVCNPADPPDDCYSGRAVKRKLYVTLAQNEVIDPYSPFHPCYGSYAGMFGDKAGVPIEVNWPGITEKCDSTPCENYQTWESTTFSGDFGCCLNSTNRYSSAWLKLCAIGSGRYSLFWYRAGDAACAAGTAGNHPRIDNVGTIILPASGHFCHPADVSGRALTNSALFGSLWYIDWAVSE